MSARRTCKKRVYSGARHDMMGHQCGHAAMEDSEFCHLHGGKPEEDLRADATEAPEVESNTTVRTTLYAELRWAPGTGPVVKLPWASGYGFVERAWAREVDGGKVELGCLGKKRKTNGRPGVQGFHGSFNTREIIGEAWVQQLEDLIEAERSKL